MKLHHQIFLAMVLGGLVGAFSSESSTLFGLPLLPTYDLIGELFINALKMVVVPLITTAIISALVNIGDGAHLGRLGIKTVLYYLSTSLVAILIGIVVVNLIQPGIVDGQPARDLLGLAAETDEALASIEGRGAGDFTEMLRQLLPPNLIEAAAHTQMLGLIVFSLFFGYFLRTLPGAPGEHLRQTIEGIYQVVLSITMVIIRFAPLGVFGLIAATATRTGFNAVGPLALFFVTVLLALALHMLGLMLLIRLLANRSPRRMLQAMTPALLTAFSSASSAATLPLSMECMQKRAGVSKRTTSFVMPLGATVNMDGTALYECAAALFIAQAYGLDLSLSTQFMIVFLALATSIGVAAIPAASLVAITVILGSIGLPAEAIGLILVTDRLLDMCRTAVNVWSDSVCTVLLARSEGEEDVLHGRMRELTVERA